MVLEADQNGVPASDDPSLGEESTARIVSLLPSITEIISFIGLADQIVGITHECDYPPEALAGAEIVTTSDINPHKMTQEEIHASVCDSLKNGHSLYGMRKEALERAGPTIVFTQQLCDVCAVSYPIVLDTCAQIVAGPPPMCQLNPAEQFKTGDKSPKVISLEPTNLRDILQTILVAGKEIGPITEARAIEKVKELKEGFEAIRAAVKGRDKPKVVFMEWLDPIFSGGHWIADMLEIAGSQYDMCKSGDRSVPMTDEDFIQLDPDIILIGPCGFNLDRSLEDTLKYGKKHAWWKDMRAVQEGNVYAMDGNSYYARPGPRVLQGCGLMAGCIHGQEVREVLGEELCPSAGFQRVTLDMYEE